MSTVTVTTPKPKSAVVLGEWKSVTAIMIGNHEIPPKNRNANSRGFDICLEKPNQIKVLAVESTFNTVREGNRTLAFVVNSDGGPIKLKQKTFLSRALAFDGQNDMPELLELPHACVSEVYHASASDKTAQNSSLDSHVKVMDYLELKPSPLSLLNKYQDVIALSGEPLVLSTKRSITVS